MTPRPVEAGRGRLVATIGPPGAGKTTWRHRHTHPGVTVASLDTYRRQVSWCGCTANQDATPLALALAVSSTRAALARGATVVWDATNAEKAARALLLVLAAESAAATTAVVFLPPLAVVLARNARRDPRRCVCGWARRVPDLVVRALHHAITRDLPTLPTEGWHAVHVHTGTETPA